MDSCLSQRKARKPVFSKSQVVVLKYKRKSVNFRQVIFRTHQWQDCRPPSAWYSILEVQMTCVDGLKPVTISFQPCLAAPCLSREFSDWLDWERSKWRPSARQNRARQFWRSWRWPPLPSASWREFKILEPGEGEHPAWLIHQTVPGKQWEHLDACSFSALLPREGLYLRKLPQANNSIWWAVAGHSKSGQIA